jgi:hypothetical protein
MDDGLVVVVLIAILFWLDAGLFDKARILHIGFWVFLRAQLAD